MPQPRREWEIVEKDRLPDVRLDLVNLSYRDLHMHREFELCLLLSGRAGVHAQEGDAAFGPSDFFLLNPRQPHQIRSHGDGPARILSLQVSPRFCERAFPEIRNVEFDAIDVNPSLSPAMRARLRTLLVELGLLYFEGRPNYELACLARIHLLFHALLEAVPWHLLTEAERTTRQSLSERLNRILWTVETHYAEKTLLTDIARSEGLSLAYLSHSFHRHLGISFQDYVALLRFEEARRRLERTDASVSDVSAASGFSDVRYLRKAFDLHLGCTPDEFRRKSRSAWCDPVERGPGAAHLTREESLAELEALAAPPPPAWTSPPPSGTSRT